MTGDPTVPDFGDPLSTSVAIEFTNGPDGWEFSGLVIQYGGEVVDLITSFFNIFN